MAKLLLESGKVDVDSKDFNDDQTRAAEREY